MTFHGKTWVVTDGKAGAQSQSIGLANSLQVDYSIKKIELREPWIQLSPWLLRAGLRYAFTKKSAPLTPPWPELVISSGSRSSVAALYIKSQSPNTKIIQIQSPGIRTSFFDVLICPEHDKINHLIDKENVIRTKWVMHSVTPEIIAEKITGFSEIKKNPSQKCLAVLVGGKSRVSKLTPSTTAVFCQRILQLQQNENLQLLVTASRRTGKKNLAVLQEFLSNKKNVFFVDPLDTSYKNPYYAFLGLADVIMVTSDSLSMISEACSTGKPVYLYDLPRKKSKFDTFYKIVLEEKTCRFFNGVLDTWDYTPPNETSLVASKIKMLLE